MHVASRVGLFLCFAAVATSWDMESLDADISQLHAAPKGIPDEASLIQSKQGAAAAATVKIWDKSFSQAAVSTAQGQLTEVVERLGRRHPELLGESATIRSFAQNGAGASKMAGGIEALRAVLDKVDGTHRELSSEKRDVKATIKSLQGRCSTDVANAKATISNKEAELSAGKTQMDKKRTRIAELRAQIKASQRTEAGEQPFSYESQMSAKRTQLSRDYSGYWTGTDKRAKTRDVLMKAVWLVCYGFKSFQQDSICVKLRTEPDFQEPSAQPRLADGHAFKHNLKVSGQFADYMRPLWKQQKLADMHLANSDGDGAGNKGFVNQHAPTVKVSLLQLPLGTTSSSMQETDALIQEQNGVPAGTTNAQMALKLNRLVETTQAPPTIAIPIQGLVSALQTSAGTQLSTEVLASANSLVSMLTSLDREMGNDQAEADTNWYQSHKSLAVETHGLLQQMEQEGRQQDRDMQDIASLEDDMGTIRGTLHGHEASIALSATQMKEIVEGCERDYVAQYARLAAIGEEQVNIQKLNSLLRFLAVGDNPTTKCTVASGVPCDKGAKQGVCTWKTRGEASDPNHSNSADKSAVFCACAPGWYGTNCELKKCPGLGHLLYKNNQDGVCSNRGGDCDGARCASDEMSTGCNNDGTCSCNANYYHGAKNKCENKYCRDDEGATTNCGGNPRGTCNAKRGVCECGETWYGDKCQNKKCPATNLDGSDPNSIIGYFKGSNPTACNGRGACAADGKCSCGHYSGVACQDACGQGSNSNSCSGGRGVCSPKTGLCQCSNPYSGSQCTHGSGGCRDCRFVSCAGGCAQGGFCDRIVGQCTCFDGNYNGGNCAEPSQFHESTVDWSRSFDKWGWSLCPTGSLLVGMSRDTPKDGDAADALYNIQAAKCRRPTEGASQNVQSKVGKSIELGHCYHENWWRKFDTKGGRFCRRNYFVAGLFRSHCNSLYCLEMAKCCQVKRSLWNDCKWTPMTEWKKAGKFSEVESHPGSSAKAFIAGFYRGRQHTLDGLEHMRQCVPVFWGASDRDN